MRFTVNIDFTDDELRQYAEDVGRRWILSFIHETIAHLGAMRLDPSLLGAMQQAVSMGFDTAMRSVQSRTGPPYGTRAASPHSHVQTGPVPRGAAPHARVQEVPAEVLTRCFPIDDSPYVEKGWGCHVCATYNGLQRPVCRNCGHPRCDVIIPPVPGPNASPNDPTIPPEPPESPEPEPGAAS